MKKNSILLYIIYSLFNITINGQSNFIDSATFILENVHNICMRDSGKLWGHNLWRPVKIVNIQSGQIISNIDIISYNLQKNGDYFFGFEPKNPNKDVSNVINKQITSINFRSTGYSNLIEDVLHDSYHSLQSEFGLAGPCYQAVHISNTSARILLRLEWHYLWYAQIEEIKENKLDFIDTALFFRNYRRNLFPGSDTIENRFEILEGMAEFTGIYLSSMKSDSLIKQKIRDFRERIEKLPDYTSNYGYLTGLLYGSLLSQFSESWTREITKDTDLGLLLSKYTNNKAIIDVKKFESNAIYKKIEKEEKRIEDIKEKEKTDIAKRFENSQILTLQMNSASYSYNPTTFLYIDSLGTYCPYFSISADWGNLIVNQNGGIFSKDWKSLTLPISSISINGKEIIDLNNWKLILSDNWVIQKKSNDFILKFN